MLENKGLIRNIQFSICFDIKTYFNMKKLMSYSILPLLTPFIYFAYYTGSQPFVGSNINVENAISTDSSLILQTNEGELRRADIMDTSVPPKQISFSYRKTQILFGVTNSGKKYCAFPSTIKLNDSTVLITFKQGFSHYKDTGQIDLIRYNPITNKVISERVIYKTKFNNQNPEIIKMPNGDIVIYIDRQMPGGKDRLGLEELRSTDNGESWKDMGPVGPVDGVQYGYAFGGCIDGNIIYFLWMTFPELKGSGGKRSVHVVKSNNNGESWLNVKDLTSAYKTAFNESTIEKYKNKFLIVGRGDKKDSAFLFETDMNFNLIKKENLSSEYSCIGAIGRPRLFIRREDYYLISRNNSCLFFYKINPATLQIEKWSKLYKSPGWGGDAHYAEPYFQKRDGITYLNVVDYFPISGRYPEIVRFEYRWKDLN